MYVEVRGTQADVREPDNCRALDVRVSVADRPGLDAALRASGLGRWAGGDEADLKVAELNVVEPDVAEPQAAELNVAELQAAAAGSPVGSDWPQRWAAMLDYAATKGWLSPDGAHLRAHLVELA